MGDKSSAAVMRPPRRAALWLALAVAVALGAVGAATAGRLGWRHPPSLPDDAAVRAVVATALPGQQIVRMSRHDAAFDYDPPSADALEAALTAALGADDYGPGTVRPTVAVAGDPTTALAYARQRLSAAGWRVGPVRSDYYGRSFWATRDRVTTSWQITNVVGDVGVVPGRFDPELTISIARTPPPAVGWTMAAGWLVGAALGAAAVLVIWRRRVLPHGRWAAVGTLAWTSVGLAAPATGFTLLNTLANVTPLWPGPEDVHAPWDAYMMFPFRPLALVAAALALVAIVTALPRGAQATGAPALA